MVNFKLGEALKNKLISMSQVWEKEKLNMFGNMEW